MPQEKERERERETTTPRVHGSGTEKGVNLSKHIRRMCWHWRRRGQKSGRHAPARSTQQRTVSWWQRKDYAKKYPSWGEKQLDRRSKPWWRWKHGNKHTSGDPRHPRGHPHGRGRGRRQPCRPPSTELGERGSKRKADEPPRPSRWIGPHGITEQEAQELETDSFLADLGEVAEMATLPLPTMPEDTAEATTVPWTAAALGENSQLSAPTRPRSEGEGEDPDSSPESHRRRRLHSVHFNRHGPM